MKPDVQFLSSASALKWSYLNSISKQQFEELKRNGHLWLSLPKVPLITTIDYDDFKKITQAEVASQKQDLSQVETQTLYKSYLSPEAVKAYTACLQNESPHLDITVPPTASEHPEFFVTLTWIGPRGVPAGKFDDIGGHHFQIIGGEIPNEADYDKIESLQNGKSLRVKVRRDLSKPFGFSASVDGNSDEVGLPPKADPAQVQIEVVKSAEQPAYGDGLNDQHNGFCLAAKANQTFLTSTIQPMDRRIQPPSGRGSTEIKQPVSDKNICATANAVVDNPREVMRITSWIEVLAVTTTDPQR
jgi:hypothetical protein